MVLLLPERRAGLQIVHEEFGRLEGRLPVREAVTTRTMSLARHDAAIAVDDGEPMSGQRAGVFGHDAAISASAMPG